MLERRARMKSLVTHTSAGSVRRTARTCHIHTRAGGPQALTSTRPTTSRDAAAAPTNWAVLAMGRSARVGGGMLERTARMKSRVSHSNAASTRGRCVGRCRRRQTSPALVRDSQSLSSPCRRKAQRSTHGRHASQSPVRSQRANDRQGSPCFVVATQRRSALALSLYAMPTLLPSPHDDGRSYLRDPARGAAGAAGAALFCAAASMRPSSAAISGAVRSVSSGLP